MDIQMDTHRDERLEEFCGDGLEALDHTGKSEEESASRCGV
jgi:hypothetical protein